MSEVFNKLGAIDVSNITEKKGQLTYLSWAHAWAEACKVCDPIRKVYKTENGCLYHTDGKTCWVEVGVKIGDVEHVDYLPVMDFKNKSIPVNNVSSMDVNKAIQRSTTKALALHGLGLSVYAGEDLPIVPPTPPTPSAQDVQYWIDNNGKTPEECISHIESLGCEFTNDFREQIKGMVKNG